MRNDDVIVAVATPSGEGALGVLRLSGKETLITAQKFIQGKIHLSELSPRVAYRMEARDGTDLLDRVVVTFFRAPASYTGEDLLEISAHGSPYILNRLLELAQSAGARLALPGEFTFRAFLRGKLDLSQAEAVSHLIRSRTELSHRLALSHLEGGISRKILELKSEILGLMARLEVSLDHSDEDIPLFHLKQAQGQGKAVLSSVEQLLKSFRIGNLIREGIRVALVGSPNVGKSSLLNALLGRSRAIVSDVPGTTRDTLEESAQMDGLTVVLVDTAGIRDHVLDSLEKEGIERTRRAVESSDLVLWVIDHSRAFNSSDRLTGEMLRNAHRPIVLVLNKSDLNPVPLSERDALFAVARVCVSAKTSVGMKDLSDAVHHAAGISEALRNQAKDVVWIASARHRGVLEKILQEMQAYLKLLGDRPAFFEDLATVHLKECLDLLNELVGGDSTEDVLSTIFSNFCIGK